VLRRSASYRSALVTANSLECPGLAEGFGDSVGVVAIEGVGEIAINSMRSSYSDALISFSLNLLARRSAIRTNVSR
jgi:hypothetical protein